MKIHDVLIIGGGVCGMTAALYAARANLSVLILEKQVCGGLVNGTHTVENYPSYPSIHGMELMGKCREHIERLGVAIAEVDEVERVLLAEPVKKAFTAGGEEYRAQTVIVATGRVPRPLPVPTDFGRVHHCSVCDGTAYKDKRILVVGGGNSGFDESLYLLGLGVEHIHIVEALPSCAAAQATRARARDTGKIDVSTSTRLVSVDALPDGTGRVRLEREQDAWEEEVAGIFCFIGQSPCSALFEGILDRENGYIKTGPNRETNIPGVFAAGDVIVKNYRQITTAMGDGTIAALQAERYLRGCR